MVFEDYTTINKNDGRNWLNFICESASYPVFRDYNIIGIKDRMLEARVAAKKDFLGGSVKLQLIDPAADPLIDSSQTALVEVSLSDYVDTEEVLKVNYIPTTNKPLNIRLYAMNSSGNVYFDDSFLYLDFAIPMEIK